MCANASKKETKAMKKADTKSALEKKSAKPVKPAAVKTVSAKKAAMKPATPVKPVAVKTVSAKKAVMKPSKPVKLAGMKAVYAKAVKAAGYTCEEREDRLIFTVKEDTFVLMIEEKVPERFSLVSGFTVEKIKYPIDIFEEMNLTMLTTPYVRVYCESAEKKGEFVVLFEVSQICAKAQIPMLLKAGIESIAKAMEMFGDMN